MDPVDSPAGPWRPDRAWADPLIALLVLVSLVLSWAILQRRSLPAPLLRAGLQGRIAELPHAAEKVLGPLGSGLFKPADRDRAARALTAPWDRALAAVLAAEQGDLAPGRRLVRETSLPGPAAPAFSRCWARAYEAGADVDPQDRTSTIKALGDGWAAGLLEARLDSLEGRDGSPALQRARERVGTRIAVLVGLGLAGVAAALGGLGVALALLLRKPDRPEPPVQAPPCSGRALLLVLLGWFLGLLLAGTLTAPLVHRFAALKPFALPINVALHASWGIFLLRRSLGTAWPGFWRGLWAGRLPRTIGWGIGHLALAVPTVLAVSWLASPLTRRFPPAQQEMIEFLGSLQGAIPLLATTLTVVLLAPFFEELLFRGTLLPFLARRWGWAPAILAWGLLFGALHLQPAGLPTLGTLGVVLGAAFRKGGGLGSAILVHALWNGGVFLFLRVMGA